MASYTEHYGLHQWEPDDHFLRTDFNQDLEKIDGALGDKDGLVFGSYTGDNTDERFIELGFTPKAVYTCTVGGIAGSLEGNQYCYGGLAFAGHPAKRSSNTVAVEGTGFRVYQPNSYSRTNQSGETYYYAAVK